MMNAFWTKDRKWVILSSWINTVNRFVWYLDDVSMPSEQWHAREFKGL